MTRLLCLADLHLGALDPYLADPRAEERRLLNQIIGEAIGNILWTKNEIVAMGQKIFASRAKKNPPQG